MGHVEPAVSENSRRLRYLTEGHFYPASAPAATDGFALHYAIDFYVEVFFADLDDFSAVVVRDSMNHAVGNVFPFAKDFRIFDLKAKVRGMVFGVAVLLWCHNFYFYFPAGFLDHSGVKVNTAFRGYAGNADASMGRYHARGGFVVLDVSKRRGDFPVEPAVWRYGFAVYIRVILDRSNCRIVCCLHGLRRAASHATVG